MGMNMLPPTIVILDDEPDILILLSTLLAEDGYHVQTVQSADDLERLLHEGARPALFVLDLLLSGSDGRTLARRLKAEERTRRVPILMLSAHPSAQQEARAAGVDAFLAKPFELDAFLEQVVALLASQQEGPRREEDERPHPPMSSP